MMRGRVLAAALALMALAVPSVASADHAFLPNRFPGPPQPGAGEPPPPSPLLPLDALTGYQSPAKSFKDACGLAVDPGGQIYVADHDHDAIDIFNGTISTPKSELYVGSIADQDPLAGPCGLALGSGGAVYVNEYGRGVNRYQSGAATTFDAGPATGVAVDPSTERLYVTHSTYVAAYEPNGLPVLDGGQPLRVGEGTLGDAYGAAVSNFASTDGYLYVADAGDETVKVYDPATDPGAPVEVIDGSLSPQQGFRDLRDAALAIDQSTGNLLVTDYLARAEEPPIAVDEFSPQGNFRGRLPHAISGGEPAGIVVDPTNSQVYVTTGRREDAGVYAFGPASPSHALLATKSGTGQGAVATSPTGISCPVACAAGEAEFAVGSAVTLTATPQPHSAFTGWSVTGNPSACGGTGPCQVKMDADTEVVALFDQIPQQSLTVTKLGGGSGTVTSAPVGIDCGSTCSAGFDEGSTVTFTAAPAPHSRLAGWSVVGNPSACQGTGPCQVAIGSATQVNATFEPNPERILSVSVAGQGRVKSNAAGIDCPGACAHAFPDGGQASLVADPAPGYELLAWTGACSGKHGCFLEMGSDRGVTATFVPIEDALAVSVIGAGTGTVTDPEAGIQCGLACAGIYRRGSLLHLTATPEVGSRFIGFSGCDAVVGSVCTVTVDEAKTVTVVFGEAPEISVRRAVVKGTSARLAVSVPSPGLLEASGPGIAKARARARSEGVLSVRILLSAKGRQALRRAEEGKLSIKVSLLFTSSDGSTTRAKKILTFKKERAR